jgi:hypothetical protein
LKRTRHIEITMHSRRVTMIHGGEATTVPISRSPTVEITAEMREVVASVLEELNTEQSIVPETASTQLSRRRPLHNLRVWFRRCF